MTEPLAAIVPKATVDETIESLREEGIYDSDRRIRAHDARMIEIPITARPSHTPIDRVIPQPNPEYRLRTVEDRLAADGWDDEALATVPRSWSVLGTVIVADFEGCVDPETVGDTLLELHGSADTVIHVESIDGPRRKPSIEIIAGVGVTETIHYEHGTRYAMDLAQVMFSPGNKAERVRMGEAVRADDHVFDMFAGIGYFTLPMARSGATVTATEINPIAFKYLVENCRMNGVDDRIECYRSDCRAVSVRADRVVMGHYDAAAYLPTAFEALSSGGIIHFHTVGPEADVWSQAIETVRAVAARQDRSLTVMDRHEIKSVDTRTIHGVVDCRVK